MDRILTDEYGDGQILADKNWCWIDLYKWK